MKLSGLKAGVFDGEVEAVNSHQCWEGWTSLGYEPQPLLINVVLERAALIPCEESSVAGGRGVLEALSKEAGWF